MFNLSIVTISVIILLIMIISYTRNSINISGLYCGDMYFLNRSGLESAVLLLDDDYDGTLILVEDVNSEDSIEVIRFKYTLCDTLNNKGVIKFNWYDPPSDNFLSVFPDTQQFEYYTEYKKIVLYSNDTITYSGYIDYSYLDCDNLLPSEISDINDFEDEYIPEDIKETSKQVVEKLRSNVTPSTKNINLIHKNKDTSPNYTN